MMKTLVSCRFSLQQIHLWLGFTAFHRAQDPPAFGGLGRLRRLWATLTAVCLGVGGRYGPTNRDMLRGCHQYRDEMGWLGWNGRPTDNVMIRWMCLTGVRASNYGNLVGKWWFQALNFSFGHSISDTPMLDTDRPVDQWVDLSRLE